MAQGIEKPLIVVMGVAGSGKTTIANALAERLVCPLWKAIPFIRPPM